MDFKNISTILIWSPDYKKLSEWYRKMFGLKLVESIRHPKDTGDLYRIGNVQLWIGQHGQVKGKNKDFNRHMFNIDVDSVGSAYAYLKKKGVKFLAQPFKAPTFNKYFVTFYDLDNNLIQLIGKE